MYDCRMLGKKAAGGNVIKWLFKYLLFTFLLFFFVLSVSAKIVLAESILVIDEEAFLGDTLLEEVGIPDNTVAIGSRAFAYTSLRVITIPFSVQEIAKDAFEGVCTPLLIITDPDSAAVEYALNNNRDFRANSKFRALIIGQVNYPAPYKLEGPEKDITKLSDLLNEYEVTIKTNLTANEMLDSVSKVFSEAKSEDISLFYYCGHGNENDGALIGIDMDSHVSATDLRSVLDGIPGRKIVLIDACYSGALIGRSLSKNNEDPSLKFINAFTRRSRSADLKMNQYYIMASSKGDEESWETSEGGVFTDALVKSKVNADSNSDTVITFEEVYEYTKETVQKVVRKGGKIQTVQGYPENCFWFGIFR